MDLPRDEIAFRKEYECLVLERAITTVFRPGNRIYPNWRGYRPGEVVTARIIEKCGCDRREIPPVFNNIKTPVQIAEIAVFPIGALEPAHFQGSSPDVADIGSLKDHLHYIYGRPVEAFGGEVTRIGLRYLG